jgi:hypothetical protein
VCCVFKVPLFTFALWGAGDPYTYYYRSFQGQFGKKKKPKNGRSSGGVPHLSTVARFLATIWGLCAIDIFSDLAV